MDKGRTLTEEAKNIEIDSDSHCLTPATLQTDSMYQEKDDK